MSEFHLDDEAYGLFAHFTGVEDRKALEEHIRSFQSKALAVYNYPCIQGWRFAKLRLRENPEYKEIVANAKGKKWLDVGCCMGTDLRQLTLEGLAGKDLTGLDLEQDFIDIGKGLFKGGDTSSADDITWIISNIFNNDLLTMKYAGSEQPEFTKGITAGQNLNALKGTFDVISAGSVFHLFNEAMQADLAKRLTALLSNKPGSVIFGQHGGLDKKGFRTSTFPVERQQFLHGPESFIHLFADLGFDKSKISVSLRPTNDTARKNGKFLEYCVRR